MTIYFDFLGICARFCRTLTYLGTNGGNLTLN